MLNRYPLWKNLFITLIVAMGFYYAAPNLYAPDPALQIGGSSSAQGINDGVMDRASQALSEAGIGHFGQEVQESGKTGLVRLDSRDEQLKAQAVLQRELGGWLHRGAELSADNTRLASQWCCAAHEVGP
jgi:preprotein translocase subunit SecD